LIFSSVLKRWEMLLLFGAYSQEPDNVAKAAKARGTHLRVHFKHCREIGQAIKGRSIAKARSYLENVLAFKEAIPFTKYTGGIGRHAVAKQYKTPGDKVQWPQKATKTFLDLLRNIESNAEAKGLELDKVMITSVNCNQAPKMRRRTYRAHGRINGTMQILGAFGCLNGRSLSRSVFSMLQPTSLPLLTSRSSWRRRARRS
jgi:large subunit ribosomal protein L17e